MQIANFRMDKVARKRVNTLLALPRFTRADLLSVALPRIDSAQLMNWLRRGILDIGDQVTAVGTAQELRQVADELESGRSPSAWRRYTGTDMLKTMVLARISHSGIPLSLAHRIFDLAIQRLVAELMEEAEGENVIVISGNDDGEYEVDLRRPSDRDDACEWQTFIEIDRLIGRFLHAAAGPGVGRQTAAMDKDVEVRSPRK